MYRLNITDCEPIVFQTQDELYAYISLYAAEHGLVDDDYDLFEIEEIDDR